MHVVIHPLVNILYAGFYVQSFEHAFGASNVHFSVDSFEDIPFDPTEVQMLCIVFDKANKPCRIAIDTSDFHAVKPEVYQWCDVYAHCNANLKATPVGLQEKLVPLCPSFGISVWNPFMTVVHAIQNALLAHPNNYRHFIGKYKRTITLCTSMAAYSHIEPRENYIFSCSTLWYSDEWNHNDENVNLTRARFIRACKKVDGLLFEGGLVSQGDNRSNEQLFQDCLFRSVSKTEWLSKTQQSVIVFNTPAFWGCHGWKLGEYLALGKCIISTPLLNDLPHPLEHGVNIHFVENTEESMREAIQYILAHPDYREHLENGALTYWQQYGSQSATLSLLLKN